MGWIWRVNQNLRYYKRILPLLVITSTLAGVLTIAAGFSSRLARNNYEVLLLGNNCGDPIRANLISQDDLYQKEIPRQAQTLSSASNYALSCYSQNTSSTESCHSMVKPSLTYTVDADAPCPFGLTCLDNNIGIKLDSGIIDSHMDLGINSPLERRSWTRYQYGAPPQETDGDYLNYTYEASNDAYNDDQVMRPYYNVQKGSAEYILGSISGDRGNDSYRTMYFPSKDLRSSTTDTSLVFLSGNGVKFMEKTPDPCLWDSQKLAIDYLPFKNDLGAFNWTIARYFEYPADITDVLGAHALLSRRGLNLGMQGPIADNQWQLDVTYWFETALAAFQKIWVYSAAGDHPYLTDDLIQRPNSTGQEQFCRNQLQRLAYEELGMGQWDGCDGEIPYTRRSTELEALDLSNLKHPRIISPDMKIKSCSTTVSVVEDISKGEKISINASEKSFQISSEEDNISRKFGVTELFTEGDERK
ncbi:hypothetical protein E8E14_013770 [Neopestalotiopsis sp. 37M]|nr:hypothetical protein E8E14_013770 [Neopestalotiopsis sp. 37M]